MIQARHVFHSETTGWDTINSWMESSGEPTFVFGRKSGQADGFFFSSVKKDFRNWLAGTDGAVMTIYHDGTGADALGPLDACQNKVLFMHTWYPRWENNFEWMIRFTGKVIVGNPYLAEIVRQRFKWVPDRYVLHVRQPAIRDSLGKNPKSSGTKRTGIWLHGYNWKRFGNRLRRIFDQWMESYGEIEIIASGKEKPGWANKPNIRWSNNLPLEFALLRLYTWDSTLLLNDYALQAPWLLRAMQLGIFPLIPDGGSTSRTRHYENENAPQAYSWGDMPSAMEMLTQWRNQKQSLEPRFGHWVRELLEIEQTNAFAEEWNAVKNLIHDQKVLALRKKKAVAGWMPLIWYEKVQGLRFGC